VEPTVKDIRDMVWIVILVMMVGLTFSKKSSNIQKNKQGGQHDRHSKK